MAQVSRSSIADLGKKGAEKIGAAVEGKAREAHLADFGLSGSRDVDREVLGFCSVALTGDACGSVLAALGGGLCEWAFGDVVAVDGAGGLGGIGIVGRRDVDWGVRGFGCWCADR